MQSTIVNGIAAIGVTSLSLLAGVGGFKTYDNVVAPPVNRSIQIAQLTYNDGKVGQDLVITGGGKVPAQWIAQIQRKDTVGSICDGNGQWNYEARKAGNIKWFTPSEWTEDDCPPLQVGDKLSVTYQYLTSNGFIAAPSASLEITEEMLK